METNLQGTANTNFERTLQELNVGELKMKLTNEKLFINSLGSSETFALRSISGIGVVDLVDDYNERLFKFKKSQNEGKFVGGLIIFAGLLTMLIGEDISATVLGIVLMSTGLLVFWKLTKGQGPELKSAVRLIITGNNRDFGFYKSAPNAGEVGRFVALIEDTLTSYHRNH